MKAADVRDWVREHSLFTFSRSGGPGGQNVNKVSTKVTAKVSVAGAEIFSDAQRARIRAVLKNKLNSMDEIVIQVQKHRSQSKNRQAAVERLAALLTFAVRTPRRRIRTRPTKASNEKRVAAKKLHGRKKAMRRVSGQDF